MAGSYSHWTVGRSDEVGEGVKNGRDATCVSAL